MSILFGLFAGGVQLETEGVDLWIPTSSQTYKNFLEYIEIFNSGNKLNFIMFIISAKDQSSVFTQDVLKDVMSVHKDLTENLKMADGSSFINHCLKATVANNGVESSCSARNFLEIFQYNSTMIPAAESDVLTQINLMNDISPISSSFGESERS